MKRKTMILLLVACILAVGGLAYISKKHHVESKIGKTIENMQTSDGGFVEYEVRDTDTDLYSTNLMVKSKILYGIDVKKITYEAKQNEVNNLQNVLYLSEIGVINKDYKYKKNIETMLNSYVKLNDLTKEDKHEKNICDIYNITKVASMLSIKLNNEEEFKKYLTSILKNNDINKDIGYIKLIKDSLKVLNSNYVIDNNMVIDRINNYFNSFNVKDIPTISGIIKLNLALELCGEYDFKMNNDIKNNIIQKAKDTLLRNEDDLFYVFNASDILKKLNCLDAKVKEEIEEKLNNNEKYILKDGSYSGIYRKSSNIKSTYAAVSILKEQKDEPQSQSQLENYLKSIVNKSFNEQTVQFKEVEQFYDLLLLIDMNNISISKELKNEYIQYFLSNINHALEKEDVKNLFFSIKALKLLKYENFSDDIRTKVQSFKKYVDKEGVYNFPDKGLYLPVYNSIMISINKDLNINMKYDKEKLINMFSKTIQNDNSIINVFYSLSALQILDNNFEAKKYVDKALLDKFRYEDGYSIMKDKKVILLYPTLYGVQIERVLNDKERIKYY